MEKLFYLFIFIKLLLIKSYVFEENEENVKTNLSIFMEDEMMSYCEDYEMLFYTTHF